MRGIFASIVPERDRSYGRQTGERQLMGSDAAARKLMADLHDEIRLRGLGGFPVPAGVELKSVEHLGSLVRRQRRVMGISQGELAGRAGVGRRYLSDLENGKTSVQAGPLLKVCASARLCLSVRPHLPETDDDREKPKTRIRPDCL
jgi:DNA-binding XRE family transcriptional regulator